MKIALVTPTLWPSGGGPAVTVPRLAMALAARGLDVELHAMGDATQPEVERLEYFVAPRSLLTRVGWSPPLRASLFQSYAQLIHANCLWMYPLGYAAAVARKHRVPLVISPRGMLAPWALRRSPIKKKIARNFIHPHAFEEAAGWHATSPMEAEDIRRLGFRQPICVAPNGIEIPRYDPEHVRRHYLEAAPAIRGRRVLLFFSRFHSKKRILELLGDFAPLADRFPDWHLLVVGIPEEYTVARLEERARELGLARCCTILDGRGRPSPYAAADLFVLPTHDENFGRVVAEALVAGLPVLTTTGAPWRALDEVGAGRCVEIADIARELAEMMSWPAERRREAGVRGYEWVLKAFDWDTTATTILSFYELLLAAHRR